MSCNSKVVKLVSISIAINICYYPVFIVNVVT